MSDPTNDTLGSLSAIYESGKRGSKAIGWDAGGGASYGRYQIATKVGTMDRYLEFCKQNYLDVYSALAPLAGSKGDTKGAFARKWIELAGSGLLKDSEHAFIKATHYDVAYKQLSLQARVAVDKSWALKQVLWSTAVQHGPKGASTVFNSTVTETGGNITATINGVYFRRSRRLGNLPQSTKNAVRNRFVDEKAKALKLQEVHG